MIRTVIDFHRKYVSPFDEGLDRFYRGQAVSFRKCPICGWEPLPEYAGMYSEYQMHFDQMCLFSAHESIPKSRTLPRKAPTD
jgi:hypothetical protein